MAEEKFDHLTVEELCIHKNWKARVSGYIKAAKLLDELSDEHSDEWNKYVPIIKNILLENNDPALEKGLEIVLLFVSKSALVSKLTGHIVAGLVKKCVASSRTRCREMAKRICLVCVETDTQKCVSDEILKGTESKSPKIVVGCVDILTEIVKAFGTTAVSVEGVVQKLPILLENSDSKVRIAAKSLTVELYRWLGTDLTSSLLRPDILRANKLAEIVSEIAKIQDRSVTPSRHLKSIKKLQQPDGLKSENSIIKENSQCGTEHINDFSKSSVKPVEIISRIPSEFYILVKSSKWSERRYALDILEKLILPEEIIQNGDYTEVVNLLVGIISKDVNVIVVCLAVKCVTHLALKLRGNFSPYSLSVFRALLDKLKDKKLAVVQALREALDAVVKFAGLDHFADNLLEGLRSTNPNVRSEVALFLSRYLSQLSPTSLNKECLKPLLKELGLSLSDQDPNVRDRSAKALGVVMVILGEKAFYLLFNKLDKIKLSKIKEYSQNLDLGSENKKPDGKFSKPLFLTPTEPLKYPPSGASSQGKTMVSCSESNSISHPKLNSVTTKRENLCDIISEETLKALTDKDWTTRHDAIVAVQKTIASSPSTISNHLGDLGPILRSRVLDNNPKISAATINLLTSLAQKIGPSFRENLKFLLPALLKVAGDGKGAARDLALESLSKLGDRSDILKNEYLFEALKTGSNAVKAKLWRWVAVNLPEITLKDLPKSVVENLLSTLFSCIESKNKDVRSESFNAIDSFLKILGLNPIIIASDKHFVASGEKKAVLKMILERHGRGSEVQITPTKTAVTKKTATKKNSTPLINRKKVSFADSSNNESLLDVNNLKNERVLEEQKHKTSKWDFVGHKEEFVELLKGLMSAANFNKELVTLMFHPDFKSHITAMDLLTGEISRNSPGIICNLDLILRWLTLRFFDGNPTVLSKSLDFVISSLENLKRANYCLLDSEASAFVPYLVLKLGDTKENVQSKVKEILLELTSLYPVSKLRKYVIDGCRSNIARQRANCLDVIARYIDGYGECVYRKEIDSVTAEVGKLLRDRDPGVKRKAYLVAGMFYAREGATIIKTIAKHSGEDFHTIEGRIQKHVDGAFSKKYNGDQQLSAPAAAPQSIESENLNSQSTEISPHLIHLESETTNSAHFQWNSDVVRECDALTNLSSKSVIVGDIDLSFLKDNSEFLSSTQGQFSESGKWLVSSSQHTISRLIEDIACKDLKKSKDALNNIKSLLIFGGSDTLIGKTDAMMRQLIHNLEYLGEKCYSDVVDNYGTLFEVLITICDDKQFIERFREERLGETIQQLLLILSNSKFGGEDNEFYRRTVNVIILKILENSNKTLLMRALIGLLGDSRNSKDPLVSGKFKELCMKCLWKLNRSQSTWDEELNYAVVFPAIRNFLKSYHGDWWKSSNGDMALRTVKTVLRTMVKLRQARVLDDVDVNDDCDLRRYLTKLLKYLTRENAATPQPNPLTRHITPNEAKELSDICGEVAHHLPGAIEKLKEFKKANPHLEVDCILSTLSPALIKYFLAASNQTLKTYADPNVNQAKGRSFSEDAERMWCSLKSLQDRIDSMKDKQERTDSLSSTGR